MNKPDSKIVVVDGPEPEEVKDFSDETYALAIKAANAIKAATERRIRERDDNAN